MTDKEPIAIRLAEWFENGNKGCEFKAAAELRRLYEENKRLKKEWVGLTKEEAKEITLANRPYVIDVVAALEAKLKEKNHG
jgi:hypothetical protein